MLPTPTLDFIHARTAATDAENAEVDVLNAIKRAQEKLEYAEVLRSREIARAGGSLKGTSYLVPHLRFPKEPRYLRHRSEENFKDSREDGAPTADTANAVTNGKDKETKAAEGKETTKSREKDGGPRFGELTDTIYLLSLPEESQMLAEKMEKMEWMGSWDRPKMSVQEQMLWYWRFWDDEKMTKEDKDMCKKLILESISEEKMGELTVKEQAERYFLAAQFFIIDRDGTMKLCEMDGVKEMKAQVKGWSNHIQTIKALEKEAEETVAMLKRCKIRFEKLVTRSENIIEKKDPFVYVEDADCY